MVTSGPSLSKAMTTDDPLKSCAESSRDDRCRAPCSTETAPVYPLLWRLPKPNVRSPRAIDRFPSGDCTLASNPAESLSGAETKAKFTSVGYGDWSCRAAFTPKLPVSNWKISVSPACTTMLVSDDTSRVDAPSDGAARIARQIPHRSIIHRECRPLIPGCIGSAVLVQRGRDLRMVRYSPSMVYVCATTETDFGP